MTMALKEGDEPQRRLTNVHNRYHVGCATCGFVGAFSIKGQALVNAEHHFHGAETTVFDSMARHGKPDCWHWTGSRYYVDVRPERAR